MLNLQLRTSERRPIASFELGKDENLSDRVREEIKKAAENGNINSLAAAPTIPAIAIFEEDEEAGSIALFNISGDEVTNRNFTLSAEKNAKGDMTYAVTGTDVDREDILLAVMFDETRARTLGALWKAGVFG